MFLKDDQYYIGNTKVSDLIETYGAPLYVYDIEVIKQQFERLQKAFGALDHKILFACKALTNQSILKYLKQLGSGLDCVSIQEVRLGLLAGFKPNEIFYTPNCVGLEEIQEAVELGINITIDNLSILELFAQEYGGSIPVCIRINPHIFAGGNPKISVGHIDSKFGISIYQMRHLERIIASSNIRVVGLHMHTGSDILDVDVFMRSIEILLSNALAFKDLEYLDFGSGFKVPYAPEQSGTDIEEFGEKLSTRMLSFFEEYGRTLKIHFEPGKFLVSQAGTFLVKTNVIKQTTATVFAGVDSGMNHLIRPMFYDAYHHIINASNPSGKSRFYTVVGYICETDTFAWDRKISEIKEGDYLAFLNAGAYAFMMSSNYNSRFKPAEVLVFKDKHQLIRKRETLEDLTRNQIEATIFNG